MAILCFPLFTCFRADSQLFGWVTAIRLSPSYLAESHPNGWTAAIWLIPSHLAEPQPFGWITAIWLNHSHLAESQPFGWVPAIWLAGPLAQPVNKQLNGREIWLPKLVGWLSLWPSQPNVAAKILKWLETCFQRFQDSATLCKSQDHFMISRIECL